MAIAPVAERGGSDRGLAVAVAALGAAGWECHVVLPAPSPMADQFLAAGAHLHVVPMRRITRSGSVRWWTAYVLGWPLAVVRLVRLARRIGVDVVYTNSLHSWYGWAVARLCRRPHVWHAREIVIQSRSALALERFLTRHFADAVVAMSSAIASQLHPRRLTVIYETPDIADFTPERAGNFRSRVGIPDDVPVVGVVGRVDTWKGFDVMLDAVPVIHRARADARAVLVGPAVRGKESYAADLAERARAVDGVWWLGPRQDVSELMADLDVFVLPSTEPEPFGLVLVEALACGVPVVATAAGGPLEILQDLPPSAARLVPPRDPRTLAGAVVELLPEASSSTWRKSRRPLPVPTSSDHALADVFASVLDVERRSHGSKVPTTLSTLAGRVSRFVLPVGAPRRQWVSRRVRALRNRWFRLRGMPPGSVAPSYEKWLRRRTPTPADLEAQRGRSALWTWRPLVSVCVAVCRSDPVALGHMLESVEAQSYETWELCLAVDESLRGDSAVFSVLEGWRQREPRLRPPALPVGTDSKGAARTTNRALDQARGEYVALLDDRDVLEPHALYMMVKQLQTGESTDLVYADEDVTLSSGTRARPFLKPGWCPEALLAMDYVGRFLVARRTLVESLGGMRPEREGVHHHDLALRLTEVASGIAHVSEVLCSAGETSGHDGARPSGPAADPGASCLRRQVVADALERRGIAGVVEAVDSGHEVRVRYRIPEPVPHVEILVPTRDRLDLLRPCLDSVGRHTDYPDYAVTVIDNDSRDPATMAFVRGIGLKVMSAPGPFNYARIMNDAVRVTPHEFIVTLNNDTVITDDQWLRGLLELCCQPHVGAVGCRLVFSSGAVQHEGIVLGHRVPAANLVFETPGIALDRFLRSTRDVSAVTGACCLMRRSAWKDIDGFDESLSVAYNDVDYCLRLHQRGYRVLYTPHVTVTHDEHATRGAWHPPEDEVVFRQRWGLDLSKGLATCDPYFSPRLALGRWGWQLTPEPPQW